MQMIKMLDQFKTKQDEILDDQQLRETLEDLRKEQSDIEFENETFGRSAET